MDGTQTVLRDKFSNQAGFRTIFHDKNEGKGRAIRTGIAAASGDAIIIQDADLEYDPMDYLKLLTALEKKRLKRCLRVSVSGEEKGYRAMASIRELFSHHGHQCSLFVQSD